MSLEVKVCAGKKSSRFECVQPLNCAEHQVSFSTKLASFKDSVDKVKYLPMKESQMFQGRTLRNNKKYAFLTNSSPLLRS